MRLGSVFGSRSSFLRHSLSDGYRDRDWNAGNRDRSTEMFLSHLCVCINQRNEPFVEHAETDKHEAVVVVVVVVGVVVFIVVVVVLVVEEEATEEVEDHVVIDMVDNMDILLTLMTQSVSFDIRDSDGSGVDSIPVPPANGSAFSSLA